MIGVALLTILVFALVGQATWLATDAWRGRESLGTAVARYLVDYTQITWEAPTVDASSILRRQRLTRFPWLEELLKRLDVGQKLSRDLRSAGVKIQAAEYLFIQLVATTLAGFVAFLVMPNVLGGVVPALGAGLLGFAAPMFWLRRARAKRTKLFEADLPDALDLLAGSLRAGYSTADALALIAHENTGPCAEEFTEVVQELNLGADMDIALVHLLERMPSEDGRLLVAAIAVQRRTGGNLVEVLKQLGRTLRERRRLREDIHVLTTQPRYSGYVASLIPPVMIAAMFFLSRKSFDSLITEPTGRIALAVSAGLVCLGLFLNDRIAKIDV